MDGDDIIARLLRLGLGLVRVVLISTVRVGRVRVRGVPVTSETL